MVEIKKIKDVQALKILAAIAGMIAALKENLSSYQAKYSPMLTV